jgi:hypothetical protein
MKQVLLGFILISINFTAFSQESFTVGVIGGSSNYLGDFNKTNPFFSPSAGYGFVLKNDYSKRYTFRVMMLKETISGSVNDFRYLNYAENQSFSSTFWDISATMEFNFLPYEVYNIFKENFTPFVFGGLGTDFFVSGENFNFPLTIPFGLGIKYNIFERFSIGFEWNARKTFFDSMDGVRTIRENVSNIHNDDWYHMSLIFITYKPFAKRIKCPTYED